MTEHGHDQRPGRVRRAAALVLAAALALAGCTPEDRDQVRDQVGQAASDAEREVEEAVSDAQQDAQPPATVEPEPTTEPATEVGEPTPQPTPQASPEPVGEDTAETGDWLPLALVLLALLAVLLLVVGALRRRRAARRAERARIRAVLGELLGTGRWVLDQGSVEAQRITEPQQLQRSWQAVRERLVGLEERAAGLLVDVEGDPLANALRGLSASSESLRSVLDGTVSLRQGPAPDPDLVSDNRLAVQQRRRDFGAALDRIATFRQ